MIRLLKLVFAILILTTTSSKAGSLYGNGDIEISEPVYKYIEEQLDVGAVKNKSAGAKQKGRSMYLAISTTSNWAHGSYCPWSQCRDDGGISTKKNCEIGAKKRYGSKQKCKLLLKGRTIKWNGNKIRVGSDDDLLALLESVGVTVEGNPSYKKDESKKEEKKIKKSHNP